MSDNVYRAVRGHWVSVSITTTGSGRRIRYSARASCPHSCGESFSTTMASEDGAVSAVTNGIAGHLDERHGGA